jgi:mannosyltransferase
MDEASKNYSFFGYLFRVLRPGAPEISKKNARVMIALLILFVIALSVFAFSKQSLRLDESQSIWQTSHSLLETYNILAKDVHVPLYETMLHFWIVFFGNGVATVRILSMIFFVLSIPSLYMLGSYAYNRRVGVLASILFCISPFMNWYGNEARMYSLFVLVTILNQYFFIRLWREKNSAAWWGYTITGLLGVYTHYFFALPLLTQAVFYFFNRDIFEKKALKKFIRTAIILTIAILPWVLYVVHLDQISNSAPLIEAPTTVDLFNTFSQFIFGFQNDHLNTILVSLWPITIILAFITLRKNQGLKKETLFFILSLLFPIVLTFAESAVYTPVFLSRYLIFTLPSLYIFLSSVILSYRHRLQVAVKFILILVMLLTLGVEIVNANAPVKENYRDASNYLMQNASADDIIVVSAPFTIYPVQYYYNGPATLTTLPIWNQLETGPVPPFIASELPTQVGELTANHANLWLLLSYDQGYQHNILSYFQDHYQQLYHHTFSYGMDLYEYKIRY